MYKGDFSRKAEMKYSGGWRKKEGRQIGRKRLFHDYFLEETGRKGYTKKT